MLNVIAVTARYLYAFFLLIFIAAGVYIYSRGTEARQNREMYALQTAALGVVNLTSLLIFFVKARTDGTLADFWPMAGLYAAALGLLFAVGCRLCPNPHRLLWYGVLMLISTGITILWRLEPASARRQIEWLFLCAAAVCGLYWLARSQFLWKIPCWLFFWSGAALLSLPFFFPLPAGGALNWAEIGGVHFQPSEMVKLCWVFYLSGLYAVPQKKLFRIGRAAAAYTVLALILLKQNDLGALLIFGMVLWFMTYLYTGRRVVLWGGVLGVCAAAVAAYFLVGHVRARFDAWLNPWADVTDGGYQIVQGLFAIAGGGWIGAGLYQGQSGYIPERTTDMIFAAITEEFGVVFAILLAVVYLLLILLIFKRAEEEPVPRLRNLLVAMGLLFGSQSFLILGGTIGLLPLTGVTLSFISYGGSSLLCSFAGIAFLQAILFRQKGKEVARRAKKAEKAEKAKPKREPEYPFEEVL